MCKRTVWSIDYHSGIDIQSFDQSPSLRPSAHAVEQSWLAKAHVVDPLANALRTLCRAGARAHPADHPRLHSLLASTLPAPSRVRELYDPVNHPDAPVVRVHPLPAARSRSSSGVVAHLMVLQPETLPAASRARTSQQDV